MRKKTLFAIINVQSAAGKYFTRKKGGNRKDTQTVVRVEKDKNNRNGSVPESHTHGCSRFTDGGRRHFAIPQRLSNVLPEQISTSR